MLCEAECFRSVQIIQEEGVELVGVQGEPLKVWRQERSKDDGINADGDRPGDGDLADEATRRDRHCFDGVLVQFREDVAGSGYLGSWKEVNRHIAL